MHHNIDAERVLGLCIHVLDHFRKNCSRDRPNFYFKPLFVTGRHLAPDPAQIQASSSAKGKGRKVDPAGAFFQNPKSL